MTFERTVLLTAILHAVILAALAVSIRRPYIVLHPFEVNLVAPPSKNLFAAKTAAPNMAPKPAVRPREKAEKAVPPPRPERQRQAMAASPQAERRARRREQSFVNDAIARLRARQQDQSLVNRALERLQGVAQVENAVIEISKKDNKTRAVASSGAAGGNAALNGYLQMVEAKIWHNWYFPDLKTHGGKAVISIQILKDGTIIANGFDKRSGDALLDDSAMRAIRRTGKVPPPPPPYPLEIAVGFTPD
ncbi:MAG: cell envelope integrity protein TolA [Nitrospiraceae bacterium]|nr:cell envelope integrity protein TolA [Nitrospiraceae bacterium]